ncbi:MAG: RidA family protein [Burkholderiaceae bacterium]
MRSVLELGKPWEKTVHFSLGVVLGGKILHTAGVTARDAEGRLVGEGDIRKQTQQCFDNLGDILAAAGTGFEHVAKYTIFTTDIQRFHLETMDVRAPYFAGKPAATLVEVSRLIHPGMLVEIEAVVHVPGEAAK